MNPGADLSLRPARRDDVAAIVRLLVACDVAEYGVADSSAEDLEADWSLDGFDVAADTRVAIGGEGKVVGYAYAGDQSRNGRLEGDVFVHPNADGPRIGATLLDFVEQRAADLAAVGGYLPEASLEVFASAVNESKRDLLLAHGFVPVRRFYRMEADLRAGVTRLHAAPGFVVRAFREDADDRALYGLMRDALLGDLVHDDEPFEAWRTRLLERTGPDPGLWFLAWEGDVAVGAVIAYDHGDIGWVTGLGVRERWRGRGLGGALLTMAFAALKARGQERVGLGVDADETGDAVRLYERAGMRATQIHDLFARPLGHVPDALPHAP